MTPGIKRILVVTPIRGGSRVLAKDMIAAFRDLGRDVDEIDGADYFAVDPLKAQASDFDRAIEQINEEMISRARSYAPDLVFIPALAPVRRSYVQECSAMGCGIAVWWVEDFRLWGNWWKDLIDIADFFFTIQPDEFNSVLGQHGYKPHFLPTGFNPRVFYPDSSPKEHPLAFVGSPYKNRIGVFEALAKDGLPLHLWGPDWEKTGSVGIAPMLQEPRGWLPLDQCAQIYRSSRIALNLHSSPYRDHGIHLSGDFVNPFLFSIPACGALQIVDRRALVSRFFEEGKEIICYSSIEELVDKCRYFISHEQEAATIARNGLERTRLENTYTCRAASMLGIMEGSGIQFGFPSPQTAEAKTPAGVSETAIPVPRESMNDPTPDSPRNPERLQDPRTLIHLEVRKAIEGLRDRSIEADEILTNRIYWHKNLHSHFSWKRHLLIRSLGLNSKSSSVVEAHASSGLITRYLGETFGRIIAFEQNPELAEAARIRCQDLSNVAVLKGNVESWKADQEFDIGVVSVDTGDYASEGKTIANLRATVKAIRAMLRETGILVLALDNKTGMQYLAAENPGLPAVIPGFQNPGLAPCMNKAEVKALLDEIGLPAFHMIHIFPNHRLPSVFLTEEAAAKKSLSLAIWAGRDGFGIGTDQDPGDGQTQQLATTLANSGLLGRLANSFLVVAAKRKECLPQIPWQLISFSGDRRPSFARTRTYIKAGDNSMTVYKEGTPRKGETFSFTPNMQGPLFEGPSFSSQLVQCIMNSDYAGFYAHFNRVTDFLIRQFRVDVPKEIPSPTCPEDILLDGRAMDAIPRNIICEKSQYRLFDLEWICNWPIPLSYLLYRSLAYLPEVVALPRLVTALRLHEGGTPRLYDEAMVRILNSGAHFKTITMRQLTLFRDLEGRFFDFVGASISVRPRSLLEVYLPIYAHNDPAHRNTVMSHLELLYPAEPETKALSAALGSDLAGRRQAP